MIGGELAVPCYTQSATAYSNAKEGKHCGRQEQVRSVDNRVSCNGEP